MRWTLTAVVLVAVAAWAWYRVRRRHDRQRKLMLLCEVAGLGFAPLDTFPGTGFLPFEMFGRTPSGTSNVVWDPRRDGGVRAFDFWYREKSEDGGPGLRRTITCAAVPLPFSSPRLRVASRDLVHEIADAIGLPLVTLELEEFNRRFRVEAEDARAASALLDQRVMEGFLRLPHDVVADVNDEVLLLWAPELPGVEMLQLLQAANSIQRVLPRVMPSLFPLRPMSSPHERRWLQGRWSSEPTGADTP
ncbi:MAG TPA: hypothetical protein VMR89_02735 [Actinomycetota bacterium]|nr:hypothetical protein [Actinomycetota bacterium]